MDRAFSEPVIVNYAVLFEVAFKSLDIERKRISYKSRAALLIRNVFKFSAVHCVVIRSVLDDIRSEVNVLGHFKLFALSAFCVNLSAELFGVGRVFFEEFLSLVRAKLHISE